MMSNAGFRIYTKIRRPARELVEEFRGLPVANIADEMNRLFCVDARIKPLNHTPLLGTAFTVKAKVGDNLMFHKAIDMAQPGDVIVVDVQGDLTNSLTGEIMMRLAAKRGLAGVVVDGAVRDADALREMEFSVYAAGVTPKGPYKEGPGEINVPVSCGGGTASGAIALAGALPVPSASCSGWAAKAAIGIAMQANRPGRSRALRETNGNMRQSPLQRDRCGVPDRS